MYFIPFIYSSNEEPTYAVLGVRTPRASLPPSLTGGPRARASVNKSQKIDKTGMRRCSVLHNPSRSCAASQHFRNRSHDHLSPRVSRGVVTNRCLGNAKRDITVPTPRTSAPPWPIKNCHVPDGGAALSLQNHQVQISSKLCRENVLAPLAGSSPLLRWAPRATIGTLQTGYPCAQDLKDRPRGARLHTRQVLVDLSTTHA
jgi:hypothetical protein